MNEASDTALIDAAEADADRHVEPQLSDLRAMIVNAFYRGAYWEKKRVARAAVPAVQPTRKLWLWKNFVGGRPEYWAFDNPYPTHLDNGDPQTLGQPCGYAIFKPSRDGSCGRTEDQVLREMASVASRVAPQAPAVQPQEPVAWQWRRKGEPWTLERTFNSQVHATTDDTEVRALYAAPQAEARQEQPKQPDSSYSAQPKGEEATARDAGSSPENEQRLGRMLAEALGADHPALDDFARLVFDARKGRALSSTTAQGDGGQEVPRG